MTMLHHSLDGPPVDHCRASPDRFSLEGRHVLVLDDEPLIAMDVACMLEDAGASVAEASNADSAIAIADRIGAHERLSGAVLDVNLGDHTCQRVAERLRALGVPFVLHTGDLRGPGELVDRIGAPVVSKPAAPGELVNVLREVMAKRWVH